jgi:hypothetical protein
MSIHRLIFTGTFLGQKCQNVLHVSNPDGALSNLAIRDEMLANFIPRLRNVQNNQASWVQLSVQRVGLTPGIAEIFPLTGQVGSLAGNGASPFVAGVFSIRTGTPGRHGHGRFYLFGVHGASISNGAFESGAFASYQTQALNIEGRFKEGGTGPLDLGVAPRGNEDNFIPMTALIVRSIFGVQRRRNFGVGS